jgi:hypothetical protein
VAELKAGVPIPNFKASELAAVKALYASKGNEQAFHHPQQCDTVSEKPNASLKEDKVQDTKICKP